MTPPSVRAPPQPGVTGAGSRRPLQHHPGLGGAHACSNSAPAASGSRNATSERLLRKRARARAPPGAQLPDPQLFSRMAREPVSRLPSAAAFHRRTTRSSKRRGIGGGGERVEGRQPFSPKVIAPSAARRGQPRAPPGGTASRTLQLFFHAGMTAAAGGSRASNNVPRVPKGRSTVRSRRLRRRGRGRPAS